MKSYIRNKVIIVTGASSGFGAAAAVMLSELGAKVVICGRNAKALEKTAAKLKGPKLVVQADANKTEDWKRLVAETLKKFKRIDVLVNNHGSGLKIAPVEQMSDADFQSIVDTNLISVMKGAREVIPAMRQGKFGHIINVSSACAHFAWPGWAVYTAAKAGLVNYTRCLHKEIEEWGGKATCFIPGAARTNFCKNAKIDADWMKGYPSADDFARTLVHCIDVPPNCVIDEVSIWGTKQIKDMLSAY